MHKNKYKKINLKHNDDEIIYINNAKHIPKYDLNKAEAIFNSNLKYSTHTCTCSSNVD